tara:strand:- start:92849 stop:93559 length:711 start_codon:yes stop_codon:yes gene_type:complete
VSWLQSIGQRYRVSEDPLRTLRRIELVALLLVVLLCLQLIFGAIILAATTGPDAVSPAADSLQVPPVIGPAVVDPDERNEIISRPLFWSGRQPSSAEGSGGEKPPREAEKLQGVKLVGVFGSGERLGIIALVKDQKRRILVGESLDGWTLETIASDEIVLTNGERSETLKLQRGEVSKAAPAVKAPDARAGRPVRQYLPPAVSDDRAPEPAAATGNKSRKTPAKPRIEQGLGLGPR